MCRVQIGAVYLCKATVCPTYAIHMSGVGGQAGSLACSAAGNGGRQWRQAVEAGSGGRPWRQAAWTRRNTNDSARKLGYPPKKIQQNRGGAGWWAGIKVCPQRGLLKGKGPCHLQVEAGGTQMQ